MEDGTIVIRLTSAVKGVDAVDRLYNLFHMPWQANWGSENVTITNMHDDGQLLAIIGDVGTDDGTDAEEIERLFSEDGKVGSVTEPFQDGPLMKNLNCPVCHRTASISHSWGSIRYDMRFECAHCGLSTWNPETLIRLARTDFAWEKGVE